MDPFDWYHLLMPLAVVVCTANFLLELSIKHEHRSTRLYYFSALSYFGCLTGIALMRFSLILKPMSLLVKVAILGWLILLPSIFIGIICCTLRLAKNKNCYYRWASHCVNLIKNIFKFFATLIAKSVNIIFLLASRKPGKKTLQMLEEEEEQRKKSPYILNDPVFGEPSQDIFGGIHINQDKNIT